MIAPLLPFVISLRSAGSCSSVNLTLRCVFCASPVLDCVELSFDPVQLCCLVPSSIAFFCGEERQLPGLRVLADGTLDDFLGGDSRPQDVFFSCNYNELWCR